jgi:uncharacterized protein (DUF4415 family)
MNARPPLIDEDGEVRELTAEDLRHFRPAAEVLPPDLYAALVEMNRQSKLRRGRGPQKAPVKRPTTIRFDADVLEGLRATGPGWQTRVNDAMREWLKTQPRK